MGATVLGGSIDMWSASVPRSNFYQLLQIRFLGMVMTTNCQMAYSSWDAIAGVIPGLDGQTPLQPLCSQDGHATVAIFLSAPPISAHLNPHLHILDPSPRRRASARWEGSAVHGPRWISTCASSTAGGWIGIGKESMKDSGLIYIHYITLYSIAFHPVPLHCITLHYIHTVHICRYNHIYI